MDNQHKVIKGYRDLSKDEIDAMNEIKEMAEKTGQIIDKLANSTTADQRWVYEARTKLQIGFMLAVRSIARPTTF